ncbi:MAG: 3-dehydroquinate synthase [Elusimicrobia bacterium]|nr:3-dehydroquinate synthase [Elusimicrobiota bacterium]
MTQLEVQLGARSYPIVISRGFPGLGRALRRLGVAQRALLVSDHRVVRLYGRQVAAILRAAGFHTELAAFPAGEGSKRLTIVQQLYAACARARLERRSPLITLGGGVVGDIGGFVAATYLRGLPLVHVPTTLLAQVDAAIGGKTGVDLPEGKNLVGAFYQPRLVWVNVRTLETLSSRAYRSGLAEVIKYGVIGDSGFFQFLERHYPQLVARNPVLLRTVIRRCCAIKAGVVSRDEHETRGLREILNFGHTVGHAIEAAQGYQGYTHGEAVAIGMCAAARLGERLKLCSLSLRERLERLIELTGLPRMAHAVPRRQLLAHLIHDKKIQGGVLRFVLPRRFGKVSLIEGVHHAAFSAVLEEVFGSRRNVE